MKKVIFLFDVVKVLLVIMPVPVVEVFVLTS